MNIVIGTHGRFGEELVNSAQMIAGTMDNVTCFSLLPEMSFEEFMNDADQTIAKMEGPVIALVDLFGGTPCNVLTALSKKHHYDVITGVNLPMLIDLHLKSTSVETNDVSTLIKETIQTLQESAVHTNEKL